MQHVWGLIPAAGRGQRFGGDVPKQYRILAGEPLIVHALNTLCGYPDIHRVAIGIAADDEHWRTLKFVHSKLIAPFPGGSARADTVRLGLQAISEAGGAGDDLVAVHDAARPLLTAGDVGAVIAAARVHADGALLGLPVSDAVKRVDTLSLIRSSVDREGLWRALTPQVFPLATLADALTQCLTAEIEVLDEADAMQYAGYAPRIVQGSADNIKITQPSDLEYAERLKQ